MCTKYSGLLHHAVSICCNNILVKLTRDWLIYQPGWYISWYLGFTNILVLAKTADFIGLNRSWQNTVIFLTHPDNLRKKAQWSKSRQLFYSNTSTCGFINKQTTLTMEHASAVTAKTKASSGSFAMLEATTTILRLKSPQWELSNDVLHMPIACVLVKLSLFKIYVTHEWFRWLPIFFTPKLGKCMDFKNFFFTRRKDT